MSRTVKEHTFDMICIVIITLFILFMYIFNQSKIIKEHAFYKEEFKYLSNPNYTTYLNLVDQNLKSPPYYTFNHEPLSIPIFYNYLLPNVPKIDMSMCPSNSILQYWYTSQ